MLFYLMLLLVIGMGVRQYRVRKNDTYDMYMHPAFVMVLSGFMGLMLWCGTGMIISEATKDHIGYSKRDVRIYSLNNNRNDIQGSFHVGMFLGTGGGDGEIKTVEYYQYFKKSGTGYKRDMVPTLKTTVYEDCETNPYITVVKPKYNVKFSGWLFPKRFETVEVDDDNRTYELHVLENTIYNKNSYKIH